MIIWDNKWETFEIKLGNILAIKNAKIQKFQDKFRIYIYHLSYV